MATEGHPQELLPGYALGILEDLDTLRVAEHLTSCSECQADLPGLQHVVDALPYAVAERDPPPELKESILGSLPGRPRTSSPDRLTLWERLTVFLQRPTPGWGWISLAFILILGISNLLLWRQVRQLSTPDPAALPVIVLSSTDVHPLATGSMVIGRDGMVGTLVVDNLPPLEGGRQYQLWFLRDGERVSGGVFDVSQGGYGTLYIHTSEPVQSFTGLGVTIEPAGGSPMPTGDQVLEADL